MMKPEQSWEILRRMLLIRRFEEAAIQLWETVETDGHRHVYIGQEAVAACIEESLREDDFLLTAHRNHGHLLARGADPGQAMAEILGRTDGFNKGRGGSAGMTCREAGFLATTGQVGGQLGLGIGAAYAQKVRNKGGISVVFFGDGGLEEGIGFEAMNMAQLYALPILFVCENNSVGVTSGRAQNEWSSSSITAEHLVDIPRALGIQAEFAEVADTAQVLTITGDLIERIRKTQAPAFVEMRARRWPGSRYFSPKMIYGPTPLAAIWDPDSYTDAQYDWVHASDPIVRLGGDMLAAGQVTPEDLQSLDQETADVVASAKSFALQSAELTPQSGLTGTYA